MTDRELLELAAKAAGIEADWDESPFDPEYSHNGTPALKYRDSGWWWNPLVDDGDALRLAVKLGIEIGNYHQYGKAVSGLGSREFWEVGEPEEATRRAIVRAAAEIGKSLP